MTGGDHLDRWFLRSWAACGALALAAIWVPKYLPMNDLPQHAEQLFLLLNLNNPDYRFAGLYAVKWWTPYGLGMALARVIAPMVGILPALKILISVGVLGFPVAAYFVAKESGSDPWWSLLAFPFAFGFAFTWGFFTYIVAVPFAVAVFALAIRQARAPTLKRGVIVGVLATATYFLHGMAFGFAIAASVGVAVAEVHPWRERKRFLTLLVPYALSMGFVMVASLSGKLLVPLASTESLDTLRRVLIRLPAFLVCGGYRDWSWWTGMIMLALPFAGSACARDWRRWAPLAFTFAAAIAAGYKHTAFGGTHRMALFLLPAAMVALSQREPSGRRNAARALAAILAVGWLGVVFRRHLVFTKRARAIDPLIEKMEPNRRVLGLVFGKSYKKIPGYQWTHLPAYYQTFKGGYYEYSFTGNYPHMIVTQNPSDGRDWEGLQWYPETFTWEDRNDFDYFLIRSKDDPGRKLFKQHRRDLKLLERNGPWWLFGRRT